MYQGLLENKYRTDASQPLFCTSSLIYGLSTLPSPMTMPACTSAQFAGIVPRPLMNAAEGDRNEFRMARGFTAEWVLASFSAILCGDGWLVGAAPNMEFAPADYVVGAQDSSTNDLFSDSVDAARCASERGLLLRY